jgi:hypothetical protein
VFTPTHQKAARTNVRKALFPISVDSERFTTSRVIPALQAFVPQFQQVIVLIADGLHLYNKVQNVSDGRSLSNAIQDFKVKSAYFEQRRKWIDQVCAKMVVSHKIEWRVLNIDAVTDEVFYPIYRNVIIAFNTIDPFRHDVQEAAKAHALKTTALPFAQGVRLSEAYILEEIAVNLRIRVVEDVEAEFYMGEYLRVLQDLYQGKYGIDVRVLSGIRDARPDFHFARFVNTALGGEWRESDGDTAKASAVIQEAQHSGCRLSDAL